MYEEPADRERGSIRRVGSKGSTTAVGTPSEREDNPLSKTSTGTGYGDGVDGEGEELELEEFVASPRAREEERWRGRSGVA